MTTLKITFENESSRKCGTCSLCCKLLPQKELRYDNREAMFLSPPNLSSDGQWHEVQTGMLREEEHGLADVIKKITDAR